MASKLDYDDQSEKVYIRDVDGIVKYEAQITDENIVSVEGIWTNVRNRNNIAAHLIAKGDLKCAQFSISNDFKVAEVVLVATSIDALDKITRDTLRLRVPCVNTDGALVAKLRGEVVALEARLAHAEAAHARELRIAVIIPVIRETFANIGHVLNGRIRLSRAIIAAELDGCPYVFPYGSDYTNDKYVPVFARFVIAQGASGHAGKMRAQRMFIGTAPAADQRFHPFVEDVILPVAPTGEWMRVEKGTVRRRITGTFVAYNATATGARQQYARFDGADMRDFEERFEKARERTRQFLDDDGTIRPEWRDRYEFEDN